MLNQVYSRIQFLSYRNLTQLLSSENAGTETKQRTRSGLCRGGSVSPGE